MPPCGPSRRTAAATRRHISPLATYDAATTCDAFRPTGTAFPPPPNRTLKIRGGGNLVGVRVPLRPLCSWRLRVRRRPPSSGRSVRAPVRSATAGRGRGRSTPFPSAPTNTARPPLRLPADLAAGRLPLGRAAGRVGPPGLEVRPAEARPRRRDARHPRHRHPRHRHRHASPTPSWGGTGGRTGRPSGRTRGPAARKRRAPGARSSGTPSVGGARSSENRPEPGGRAGLTPRPGPGRGARRGGDGEGAAGDRRRVRPDDRGRRRRDPSGSGGEVAVPAARTVAVGTAPVRRTPR